jgi:RHS repeat-associated protein
LTCAEFFNPVIAKTTYRNNVFQKKEKTQYGLFSSVGHYLPQYKAEVFANDAAQTRVTYNSYASNGILSQYTPQGEAPVSLYWNTKDRLMAQSQGYVSPVFNVNAETPQAVLTFNGSNIFQHPNNHATTYVYDQHGNLKGMAEGQGNTINYGYDNFNRLSSITDLNGDTLQTFHYTIRKNGIENNVLTRTMQDSLSSHVVPSYVFYDGLGRPVQTASKGVNTSGKFVYEATVYDTNGREQQKWLPCEGGTTPLFLQDLSSESYSTYEESYAYDEYSYDPIGRPTVIMPPGERHRQANKPQRIEYVTNTANQIRKYKISSTLNSNGRYQISTDGYYAAGTLTGERYIDEDGKGYTIYKDIFDNVVYEERGTDCKTKYIYDTRGRLIAVLPPMVNQLIRSAEIYEYHYDDYNRLVKKFLPGCAAMQYWYDDADRLIYMQDGRLSSAGKYRFFLYDTLGRLVVQGICTDANRTNYTSPLRTYFSVGSAGLCNTGYISEGPTPIEPEIEVVNYYDNYSFLSAPLFSNLDEGYDMQMNNPCLATTLQTGRIVSTTQGDYVMSALYYDAKGRLTDEREKSIDSLFIHRQTEYTFTGEPFSVTECITNLKNGRTYPTITQYTYDTDSGILTTKSLQYGDGEPVTIAWNDYDGAGRIYMSERGDGAILDVYQYIASGSPKYIESSSTAPLLIENIHYNDGTGTPCYNGNISAVQWRTGNESLTRKYRYSYDDINRLIKAEYEVSNGQNPNPSASYDVDYAYNKSSSITSLVRKGQTNVGYGTIDSLAYSYNGNKPVHIKDFAGSMVYENAFDFKGDASTLVGYRYDNCGALTYDRYKGISSITYDFNGQPTNVEFQNGNSVSYVYTATGERLKCIVTTIEESSSVPLDSTWTWVNPATVIRDSTLHIGNYTLGTRPVLNDLYVTRYDFEGGYISANGGYVNHFHPVPYTFHYHYYCRDHLGNNRVVVSEDGEIEQVTHYYPYGGLFGDVNTEPGLQPYKFGGKEFQHTHGLDLYDFHARQYDPAIGLFTSMDPLCEKYYHISPYAYCMGNPVNAIDPDGKSTWTKVLKATVKIGKQVARSGGKALLEGATYANAVSDLVDDYNTLTDKEESAANRIWAGVSLASEFLPVSIGDVKRFSRNINFVENNHLIPKGKTRFFVDSNGKTVDIHATPKGSYRQPNGDRTDILQSKEHYNKKARRNDGFSHTHPNEINITSDGEEFQKWSNDTHSPTYVEINNIKDGIAEKILY